MKLDGILGLGVAGNFTGHLEQAGEAEDFLDVQAKQGAPKGVFPFYVPHSEGFLSVNPLSSSKISLPKDTKLQPEPELALLCNVEYHAKKISKLSPVKCAAFNDCSIREDAPKISQKKNWGTNSQGISESFLDIDSFRPGGILDDYALSSYLKRDDELKKYGVTSPVNGYSYFYDDLLDWLVDKMNNQVDVGPLENVYDFVRQESYPEQVLIAVGATRYTEYGEQTYLQDKDEIFIVVHPKSYLTTHVEESLLKGKEIQESLILHQIVDMQN